MGTHRQYDRSFKECAVKLSYERDNIKALAAELGVSTERIYKWRWEYKDHGEASFQGHGVERLSDEGRRVKELEKKLRNTELELEILKKRSPFYIKSATPRHCKQASVLSACTIFLKNRPVMYAFIDCTRERYTVGMMARALRISPRSYYDYKKGIYGRLEARREDLERRIQVIYAKAYGRYGAPRIAADIRAEGYPVSANTVGKYMKRMGLRSKLSRKYRNVSYPEYTLRICPNHLDCRFNPDRPGKVWVSDITYIHTTHGFRYLTSVMDLFDRKVVGWSMSNNLTASDTAVRAYQMAVRHRRPASGMIFHSDQGVQYASEEFRNTLDKNVVQSMSRRGNCWDNAVAESFFKSLKCELIYGNRPLTPDQIKMEIFEYSEIWYNKPDDTRRFKIGQ